MYTRLCHAGLAVVISLLSLDVLHAADRDLFRLDGPVVFDVGQAAALETLPIKDGVQFGAFRSNDRDLAVEQYIKYWLKPIDLAGGAKAQVLAVYYNVSKAESYCGLWIKIGGADWRRYRNGEVVFRLSQFEPLNEVAIFDDRKERVPDTLCTDNFKVELKSGHKNDKGQCRQFAVRENVRYWHTSDQKRQGYFDVRIPLKDFGLDQYLDNMALLAITFENGPIPKSQRRGNLGIQRIVLTPGRDQKIDGPRFAEFTPAPGGIDNYVEPVRILSNRETVPREPKPLNGPMVIQFHSPLDQLDVPKQQFGIFRDEDPRHIQNIAEGWTTMDLPHRAKPTGFLQLRYEVPTKFNGWWIKLLDADWSTYRFLVIRLRPRENCTPIFKLELKRSDGGLPHAAYVRISNKQREYARKFGYVDVAIPLREFGIADLSRLAELVIVFVRNEIPSQYIKGELLIESIRVTRDEVKWDVTPEPSLLNDLGGMGFEWFNAPEHRHKETGMVVDRAPNWSDRGQRSDMSSIASTGYYLSLLPEWVRLGWVSPDEAETEALRTLDFAWTALPHHHGMLFHFINIETGERWEQSEISTLDSAIFFNGCMVCAQAYGGDVAERANAIVNRADWSKFLIEDPKTGKTLLSLGWSPEKGLLGPLDVRSSETAMPLFLAVGSSTHPIDPECWYNTRASYGQLGEYRILNRAHPLFTSFYGLGWHDLRGRADRDGIDLYGNARLAALANRDYCRQLQQQFSTYHVDSGGFWGISAGDSPQGYVAGSPVYGSPTLGTVWPLAALATINVIPKEIEADIAAWRASSVWPTVCGKYGLSPFNLDTDPIWVGDSIIGIDIGSSCLSLSLTSHGEHTARDLWMEHPVARTAFDRLGITKTPQEPISKTLKEHPPPADDAEARSWNSLHHVGTISTSIHQRDFQDDIVAFSPDGRVLATNGEGGVRFWRVFDG